MEFITCKQAAQAWGIAPTRATQKGDPAFLAVAQAIEMWPEEAFAELTRFIAIAKRLRQQRFEAELPAREAMLNGRFQK